MLTDSSMEPILELGNLRVLDISRSKVTEEGLEDNNDKLLGMMKMVKSLPQLEELRVNFTAASNQLLIFIADNCSTMRYVEAKYTKVVLQDLTFLFTVVTKS